MKLWGGRFEKGPAEHFEQFSESLSFDQRLILADLEGTVAWVRALERIGIFSAAESERAAGALEELAEEARVTGPGLFDGARDEDVHTLVLRKVTEKIGPALAGRIHTGRSRNEQVALDVRLWIKREIGAILEHLDELLEALVTQAERHSAAVLPGYTHMRRAQPILWPHYCLAYFEMLARDRVRLERAFEAADAMPLGSGALAGSGLPIDREALARELGFSRLTANSLDATADRDFALEFLFAAACVFTHLSRLAEDWIYYSSEEFGFLEMADDVSSGSSLMPQKKNPDSLELIRGKTGRVYGNLVALLTIMKGLPLSYNRDMQEDKLPVFDSADQMRGALRMAAIVVQTVKPRPAAMQAAAAGGWSCATDLAEYLSQHGVPFQQSHEIVGRIVRAGLAGNRAPEQWTLEQLREFHPGFEPDALQWLKGTAGVRRRELVGGTGPQAVSEAIQSARSRLGVWRVVRAVSAKSATRPRE